MKIKLKTISFYLAVINSTIFFVSNSYAENIYQYRDNITGSTLLTNRKNNNQALTRVKVTYYPESNIHSYKNWGASEASILPSYNKNKDAFDHIIRQAAQRHGISEGLIKAVMHTESGFNLHARSPVGAQGLMQLMPATARRFNVSNAYDPQQNIMAGAEYLAWLLRRFNGNTTLALAGYNAGEGNVSKYGGIPPFRETQDYVQRVISRFNNLYAGSVNTSEIQASANSQSGNERHTPTLTAYKAPQNVHQRQIIVAADGTYTDSPMRTTYSTHNASASAHITIAD